MTENNTDSTTPTPSGKVESDQVKELLEIARRNTAIAYMLGFKKYVPAQHVHQTYKLKYHSLPMEWFHFPGVGNYNSFELRFHETWEWLMSAFLEMKKYKNTHYRRFDVLSIYYHKLEALFAFELDKQRLWLYISDYALELQTIKEKENGKHSNKEA